MENYIDKAFRALDEFWTVKDEPVYIKEEAEEPSTILDLFKKDSSYNIIHDFEIDGAKYGLYLEATCEGDSCDATFGEFNEGNIDDVIVDVLDGERNFIGTLHGIKLDSSVEEVVDSATNLVVNGEEKTLIEPEGKETEEIPEEEPVEEEEPESNTRMMLGGEIEEKPKEGEEEILEPEEVGEEPASEEEVAPEEVEKEISVEDGEAIIEPKEESLNESKEFSIHDEEEMEEAKEILDKNDAGDNVEQIVDVSAETKDDLKKTYIGSIILRCTTCHTMIYKDAADLVKSEENSTEDEEIYNVDEECPHCGATDGFEIIGQVATLETNPEAVPEEPKAEEPKEEPKEEEPTEEPVEENPTEEQDAFHIEESLEKAPKQNTDVILEKLDEEGFNKLIRKYLNETYYNIKDFKTTNASIDDENNKFVVEGKITFKSGKEKNTKFVFEAKELTKKGKIKFSGMNEMFSNKKAYTLVCGIKDNSLLSESLSYSYNINEDKVTGRVLASTKR